MTSPLARLGGLLLSLSMVFATSLQATVSLQATASSQAIPVGTEADTGSDSELEAYWSGWLDEVAALITVGEQKQFEQLANEVDREAFRRHFWRLRDPDPTAAGNRVRDQFLKNVQLAWDAVGSVLDARAQTIILHGPPRYSYAIECSQLSRLQLLYFPANDSRESFQVLYTKRRDSDSGYRLWRGDELAELVIDPSLLETLPEIEILADGSSASPETPDNSNAAILERLTAQGCFRNNEHLLGYLRGALENAIPWQEVRRRAQIPTPGADQLEAWATRRSQGTSAAAVRGVVAEHTLQLEYIPARQERSNQAVTVLQGTLRLTFDPKLANRHGVDTDRWVLRGELLTAMSNTQLGPQPTATPTQSKARKERFRQIVYLPQRESSPTAVALPAVSIPFVRDLAPGPYSLILELETLDGEPILRTRRSIEVPDPEFLGPTSAPETIGTLAASQAVSLRLVVPEGVLEGPIDVEVRTTGASIASVRYELNGQVVAHQPHRPWTAAIDLGPHPKPHTLAATGLDRQGQAVASDVLDLNTGLSRFDLVLAEPWKGAHNDQDLRARAALHIPIGANVERVDFYLGDRPLGTLFQAPFVITIPAGTTTEPTYIRAEAHLRDGSAASDVVLINAPGQMDEISVREVELFAKVFRRKRPVEDLARHEVTVDENGTRQQIRRFEHIRDLPIHLGLVVDSSTSMLEELPVCVASAVRFFEGTLGSDDQASVITFNQRTHLAVPLTNDLDWLSDGVSMLHPRGGTALWDSLIDALNYFGGLPGKRALVLISDGGDQHSRFSFQDSLEFARRSGISVYTFFLNVGGTNPNGIVGPGSSGFPTARIDPAEISSRRERQTRLAVLAEETGGLSFYISGERSIERAFSAVAEDVRSQYLITYQSSSQGTGFRTVKVKTSRPGLKVRTLRGYYP